MQATPDRQRKLIIADAHGALAGVRVTEHLAVFRRLIELAEEQERERQVWQSARKVKKPSRHLS